MALQTSTPKFGATRKKIFQPSQARGQTLEHQKLLALGGPKLRAFYSWPSQAHDQASNLQKQEVLSVSNFNIEVWSIESLFSCFSKARSSKVSTFQTLALSFGTMRRFLVLCAQISLSSMPKFGNPKVFIFLCIKSDVGLKIMCQDLDMQKNSTLDPPKFGAKHWRDEIINYLSSIF